MKKNVLKSYVIFDDPIGTQDEKKADEKALHDTNVAPTVHVPSALEPTRTNKPEIRPPKSKEQFYKEDVAEVPNTLFCQTVNPQGEPVKVGDELIKGKSVLTCTPYTIKPGREGDTERTGESAQSSTSKYEKCKKVYRTFKRYNRALLFISILLLVSRFVDD